jgi:hypothetical protein
MQQLPEEFDAALKAFTVAIKNKSRQENGT